MHSNMVHSNSPALPPRAPSPAPMLVATGTHSSLSAPLGGSGPLRRSQRGNRLDESRESTGSMRIGAPTPGARQHTGELARPAAAADRGGAVARDWREGLRGRWAASGSDASAPLAPSLSSSSNMADQTDDDAGEPSEGAKGERGGSKGRSPMASIHSRARVSVDSLGPQHHVHMMMQTWNTSVMGGADGVSNSMHLGGEASALGQAKIAPVSSSGQELASFDMTATQPLQLRSAQRLGGSSPPSHRPSLGPWAPSTSEGDSAK